MSKRELAARVLDNAIARNLSWVAKGNVKGLRILAYHRVFDADVKSFAFDDGVLSASIEDFYEQMKFVRRHFEVISFADLHCLEQENRRWSERALIVTFDDGYRDNYINAFPILKELGIPATIFLVTSHIGQQRLFWWDAICYCVKQTPLAAKVFKEMPDEHLEFTNAAQRQQAITRILKWAKQTPDELRRALVDDLPAALHVELPSVAGMHLNWDEVRDMAATGIEFGSHTVTHSVLANVSAEQLDWEMSASKKVIEQQLGKEVLAIAYPAGQQGRFNQGTKDAAAKHGYRYAVSYDEGIVQQKNFDRLAMPRIHVEREQTRSLFRANLCFPKLMLRETNIRDYQVAPFFS